MPGEVVLVGLVRVAHVESIGITAVGQSFQFAIQTGIKRFPGQGIIHGHAIELCGTGHVVVGLGAAFDLEGVDANLYQPFDMLDGTQITGVHDIGAMLIFEYRYQFTGTVWLFNQVSAIGEGMARNRAVFGEQFRAFDGFHRVEVDLLNITGFVFFSIVHIVLPAAGVGASALVGITMVEVTG